MLKKHVRRYIAASRGLCLLLFTITFIHNDTYYTLIIASHIVDMQQDTVPQFSSISQEVALYTL